MDLESAGANGIVSVDPKEAEIEEQAAADVGLLSAEALLSAAQSLCDVRRKNFAKGIFVPVKDAGVITVLKLKERRMPKHCRLLGTDGNVSRTRAVILRMAKI